MTYRVVQKINNNYYLYEVTAVWDPVKKNSKQKRKYIGKCDADGNLMNTKTDSSVKVKELGKHYLMYHVAKDMGLREKLIEAFGEDGNELLAMCINRSIRTGLPRHSVRSMSDSLLPQMTEVNVDVMLRDSTWIIAIQERCLHGWERLFKAMDKGNKAMVYELDSLTMVDVLNLNANDPNKGVTEFPPFDVFLAISENPNSAFYFALVPMERRSPEIFLSIESSIRTLGPRNITFILNKNTVSRDQLTELANSGIQFLKTVPESSEYGMELLERFDEEVIHDGRSVLFNNALIKVLDRMLVLGDIRCRIIIITNEMQRVSQMNAFYRSIGYFETKPAKSANIGMGVDTFELEDVSRYFRTEPNGDGGVHMVRDDAAIRAMERSFGKKILITNSDEPWDVLLSKLYRQDRYKSEVDRYRNELQDGSMLMNSVKGAMSTFLNEFLAIAIRTHLSDMLGLNFVHAGLNYVDVLNEVGNIHAVCVDDKWQVSEISSEQRAIFDRLGIPVPTAEFVEECVETYSKKNALRRGPRGLRGHRVPASPIGIRRPRRPSP